VSNHKHWRIISRFELLAQRPRLQHYEEFPLKSISQDHSVPQHLQRAPSRTFGHASPSFVLAKTTYASTLAYRGCTSYNSSNHKLKYLVITSFITTKLSSLRPQPLQLLAIQEWKLLITSLDHENNCHNKDPKRIDTAIESSSLCEKNKIELWWKTQEISFENTLKNFPFDMKVLAQKHVEKKPKRDGKNWL